MNFIAKKMKEQDSFRLIKENSDGTGVFIYKGESVILKRCKNGYWKDPKTGECVPSSQLQGTSQPKDVKPKDQPKKPKDKKPSMENNVGFSDIKPMEMSFITEQANLGQIYDMLENYANDEDSEDEANLLLDKLEEVFQCMQYIDETEQLPDVLQNFYDNLKESKFKNVRETFEAEMKNAYKKYDSMDADKKAQKEKEYQDIKREFEEESKKKG